MNFRRRSFILSVPVSLLAVALVCGVMRMGSLGEAEIASLRIHSNLGQGSATARLQAAAWLGNPLALRAQGLTLLESKAPTAVASGMDKLRQAAGKDDDRAALMLGKLYFLGAPGLMRDHAQARPWLEQAASRQPVANYYLALIDRNGSAGPIDRERALRALKLAADAGVPHALFLLAQTYLNGEGVARDEQTAMRLIHLAAEQEYPNALQFLAQAHARGEHGLRMDEKQANLRFALAADATRDSPAFP